MYEKPMIIKSSDIAEGVFMASGTCYTTTAYIHQYLEQGRNDYRIQINAVHNSDHNCNGQILKISFNQPVYYSFSNGQLLSGNGTENLQIKFNYWNNQKDNIGLGDLVVTSSSGLSILEVTLEDINYRI